MLDIFKIDQKTFNKTPYFLRQHLLFPYMSGANFMLRIMYANPAARDRAFSRYPLSTEQVIHPEKYISTDRDDPTSFTLPDFSAKLGPGWKATLQNVFGEFQIRTYFEYWREWEAGREAAEGWDGDRYTLYRSGDDYLLLWVSVWDSEEDAAEFFAKLSEVLGEKRYRQQFAGSPRVGDEFILKPAEEAGTQPDLHLRFRKERDVVITSISNSQEANDIIARFDDLLIRATRGEGVALADDGDSETTEPAPIAEDEATTPPEMSEDEATTGSRALADDVTTAPAVSDEPSTETRIESP
jgi:hypothetical protein